MIKEERTTPAAVQEVGGTVESEQAQEQYTTAGQKTNSAVDHALALAEQSIPVFPVNLTAPDVNGKRKKRPLPSNGHNAATTDPQIIKRWWQNYPSAAVGVPTGKASGLMAVDVDPDGAEWASDHAGLLMGAPLINYTERGQHYIWQYHEGIRNSAGKIAQGIDVRGEGGWILWWPAQGLEAYGELTEIAPAPDVLLGLIQGSQRPTEAAEGISCDKQGNPIAEGNRNATLTSEAGRLRRNDWGYGEILNALRGLNATRCTPPLDDSEVEQIARSVARYEPTEGLEVEADQDAPSFDLSRANITELLYTDPPARRWIVQDRLPLDVAGILAAAGGTGKSMATLQLAVSICSGLDWLEMEISEPGSVLMVSAEDDRDEIHRRLARIVAHYSQNNDHPTLLEQISARLFIFDRVGQDNRLTAKVDRETQRTAMALSITEAAVQIDDLKLIVLDPLSRFDGGDPNDNSDGTRLIEAAESIRRATGATVLLPHHVSKAGIRDSNSGQEAVRGASGLVDGARWVGLMAGLRADDAESYGIKPEDAGRYVRFTTPKANYSAPWDGCWLERQAGGVLVPSELKPAKEERKSRKADAEYQRIVQGVVELIGKHGPMSKRHIEDQYSGTTNILKAGQKAVRGTITRAVEEGHLIKRPRLDGHTDIDAPDGNLAGVMANV